MKTDKKKVSITLKRIVLMTIGAFFTAVGLEEFLVPNNIIDGGVVGISIMASYLTKEPLGLFIFFLNLPFLIFAYKHLGKNFVLSSFYSIAMLSIFVSFFHNIPDVTHDLLLACIFGGITVGIGVGLILRNNGSLDGTEMIAVFLGKHLSFSVGEIIMFFNIFILGSAGFVFGPDRAMYSLITYFVIYKVIDVILEGLDESKSVTIISSKPDLIASQIIHEMGRGVTFMEGKGGFTGDYKKIIYCIVTRLEISKLKQLVLESDPKAFLTVQNVHEVEGGQTNKKKH